MGGKRASLLIFFYRSLKIFLSSGVAQGRGIYRPDACRSPQSGRTIAPSSPHLPHRIRAGGLLPGVPVGLGCLGMAGQDHTWSPSPLGELGGGGARSV